MNEVDRIADIAEEGERAALQELADAAGDSRHLQDQNGTQGRWQQAPPFAVHPQTEYEQGDGGDFEAGGQADRTVAGKPRPKNQVGLIQEIAEHNTARTA